MRAHRLKIWPAPFRAVCDERKTCEVRRADRDFQVGDFLMLVEFDPQKDALTGDYICRKITHVHRAEDVPRGLIDGFVVLSITDCDTFEIKALTGDQKDYLVRANVEWLKP